MAVISENTREDIYVNSFYEGRELYLAGVEKIFNKLGYIPFVSIFTGATRFAIGKTLLIADVAGAILCTLGDIFKKDANNYAYRANQHIVYILHDLANLNRGFVEVWPFIGNFLTLFYDTLFGRFSYPVEALVMREKLSS